MISDWMATQGHMRKLAGKRVAKRDEIKEGRIREGGDTSAYVAKCHAWDEYSISVSSFLLPVRGRHPKITFGALF